MLASRRGVLSLPKRGRVLTPARVLAGARALACLLAALLLGVPAAATVRFHTVTARVDGEGTPEHFTIWIEGDRLAAEPRRPKSQPTRRRVVFQGDRDVLWLLDTRAQTYYQVDPESAAETASQLEGLRRGLDAGLEALGPEQGERVRGLLGDLGERSEATPLPEVALRPRGEQARHADLACARYDVLSGGTRTGELCMASYGQGPLQRERLRAVPALTRFLARTLPPLYQAFPSLRSLAPLASLSSLEGVPIHAQTFQGEAPETVTTLQGVTEMLAPPALFELPEGYARSWVPPFAAD